MQRIKLNGGLCHWEQKANSHESGKNGLKMFVVVVVVVVKLSIHFLIQYLQYKYYTHAIYTSFC